ncbi:BRCA1-A complex subunit Abraxas 1 isoform X2 [Eleutherodactylus coqui]|uniref:BRCA1-A complex subunit Abraxas 1 isoform X2 n=1 Tax=Eleutherodactylus coqui TaxID=57060 RepID=UPI003462D10E
MQYGQHGGGEHLSAHVRVCLWRPRLPACELRRRLGRVSSRGFEGRSEGQYNRLSDERCAGGLHHRYSKKPPVLSSVQDVIGWYKFRHNTEQTMSFRERILHNNLQTYLSNPELVFLLVTSQSTTETKSTHLMEYSLYRPQDGLFQKVPLIIANLGLAEQQGYSTLFGSCVSARFNHAVTSHRSEFFSEDGTLKEVNKITALCRSLQEELKETCSRVAESESSVEKLLQQVNRLKMQITEKRQFCKEGKKTSPTPEENGFLCQALRKFFPHSAVLQSSSLSVNGETIPHSCSASHKNYDLSNLTLQVQPSDLPEVSMQKAGKRKRPQKKANLLRMKTRAASRQNSTDDRILFTSGTETDDSERLKVDFACTQSPTF